MQSPRINLKILSAGIIFLFIILIVGFIQWKSYQKTIETFEENNTIGMDVVPLFANDYHLTYKMEFFVNNTMLNKYKTEIDNGFKSLQEYARVIFRISEDDVSLRVNDGIPSVTNETGLLTIMCMRTKADGGDTNEVGISLHINVKKMNTELFTNIAKFFGMYINTMV